MRRETYLIDQSLTPLLGSVADAVDGFQYSVTVEDAIKILFFTRLNIPLY